MNTFVVNTGALKVGEMNPTLAAKCQNTQFCETAVLPKHLFLKHLSYLEFSPRAKHHITKDFSAAEIRFINATLCLFLLSKLL